MSSQVALTLVGQKPAAGRCGTCPVEALCFPGQLDVDDLHLLDRIMVRRTVRRGQTLYHAGSRFHALYVVHAGFFKSATMAADGHEHITGFQMAGDFIGLDGINSGVYACDAMALQDSELCELPFQALQRLGRDIPAVQLALCRIMSREIVRDYAVMMLHGSMRAEVRLAGFLLSLSRSFAARGASATEFDLPMSREEIGDFLGLKVETVSRAFSRLQEDNLIRVQKKHVQLMDMAGIKAALGDLDGGSHSAAA